MGNKKLKVLSFTTLFPNSADPFHGLFVKNRLEKVAHCCDLEVVAPVNVGIRPDFIWNVPQNEKVSGIDVYHPRFCVIPGLFKHMDGRFLFTQILPQIKKLLALNEYDIVDVHYAYPDGVAGQMLARKMKRPYVISLRGSDINVLTRFPRRRSLIKDVLKGAGAVITVSEALKKEADSLGANPDRTFAIPNGVNKTLFCPGDREESRRRLGLPVKDQMVLSVGRLAPVKGFDLLIKGMKILRERLKRPVRCYIIGDGELRPALERQIKKLGMEDEIILKGRVSPQDLSLWYCAADIFCLLSHSEGCPNVVLESLACGTLVVATAVGGIPELIEEGVNGFMIKNRNEEEVAQNLETGLMQGNSFRISPVPDWTEVARRQIEVYNMVAGRS